MAREDPKPLLRLQRCLLVIGVLRNVIEERGRRAPVLSRERLEEPLFQVSTSGLDAPGGGPQAGTRPENHEMASPTITRISWNTPPANHGMVSPTTTRITDNGAALFTRH